MTKNKSTLVLGASPHPYRYANRAVRLLREYDHSVQALGLHEGSIQDISIETDLSLISADIHTISIYLNPRNQQMYYDWIINLKPERVIFNPGAENYAFEQKLQEAGIQVQRACTLVMLNVGSY